MAAQVPFPVPWLDGIMGVRTSNLTVSKPAYCSLECLDVAMAQDAIYFMVIIILTVTIYPFSWVALCRYPAVAQQHKDILRDLTRTPTAKRNEQLKRLCKTYGVEYTEVEDDGADLGGYEEYCPNIWD
jgi:hypothetical protein